VRLRSHQRSSQHVPVRLFPLVQQISGVGYNCPHVKGTSTAIVRCRTTWIATAWRDHDDNTYKFPLSAGLVVPALLSTMRAVQFALFALWVCRSNAQTTITTTGLSPSASSAAASASAAAATADTSSHTSNVQGKVFNNFYQIWLENTVCALPFGLMAGLRQSGGTDRLAISCIARDPAHQLLRFDSSL